MKLKGKVAIVTGGSRDIGRQISVTLAKEGAKIVVNYFNSEIDAQETRRLIEEAKGECILVRADMTRWVEVQHLIRESVRLFGSNIDILVNNTGGLCGRKTLEELDEEWYDMVMDLNMKSTFFTTKAAIQYMKPGSSIINITSQAARDGGGRGASIYATSKGAVMTFTRAISKEQGPRGIRVNAVSPGMIATSFHDKFTSPEVRTMVSQGTPLRRQGEAQEVANLVAFLASDESSYLTGTNIDINGGNYFS